MRRKWPLTARHRSRGISSKRSQWWPERIVSKSSRKRSQRANKIQSGNHPLGAARGEAVWSRWTRFIENGKPLSSQVESIHLRRHEKRSMLSRVQNTRKFRTTTIRLEWNHSGVSGERIPSKKIFDQWTIQMCIWTCQDKWAENCIRCKVYLRIFRKTPTPCENPWRRDS